MALVACGGGSDAGAPATGTESLPTTAASTTEAVTTEAVTTEAVATEPATTTDAPATTDLARTTEPPAETETPKALPGLPAYTAGYETWTRLNPEPIPPSDNDPHLGTKDVFVSQEADRSSGSLVYPEGTIVVKQGFRPDRAFIGLIAIMRKEQGADPDHNDWVFVEYARETADASFTELASGAVCSGCHMGAVDTDYVWVHATGAAP